MSRLLSLVGAVSLTTAFALAQSVSAPIGSATADVGGTSQNYWRELQSRWQSVYDTSVFTGQGLFSPIEINTISFRPTAGQLGIAETYPTVEVYIGYAAVDHATPSTTFALNRGPGFPVVPNFAGAVNQIPVSGATPVNQDDITINLTNPFIFDPSLGQDLLVEIYIGAVPTPPILIAAVPVRTCAFDVAAHKMRSVRFIGATAGTATGGTLTAFTPATKFDYTIPTGVAKHDPYGTGCYTIARSFYEQFPSVSNDLSGKTLVASMNANGGYDAFTFAAASLTMPTGVGLAMVDDVVSAAIPLPFTFDYAGGSTSQIFVDSNGSILLNATSASSIGGSANALLSNLSHRIAASMQDLLPDGATNINNVFAEADPLNPTSVFLITWVNVPCYNTTPAPVPATSTFQIALIDNGSNDTWEVRYQTLTNDSDSNAGVAVTGFSLGGNALNGGSIDLTNSAISTKTDLGPLTLTGSPRPVMGTPVNYQVSNVRAGGFTLMQCGFLQDLAGTSLTTYGLNAAGCNAHLVPVGLSSFGPLLFSAPNDSFSFTWPTGYPGVQLFVQAFELQSVNPENPAGILSSNGLQVLLGTL